MTACSLQSAAVGEQLAGTAPVARTWIVVEQVGPWGRDAVAESPLPADVRATLLAAKALGVGVLLARHPDRGERSGAAGHHVWIARCAAGGTRLRHAVLDDLDLLAHAAPDELAAGRLPAIGGAQAEPLLLVCTHSRRDQCCAVHGRALLAGLLAGAAPEQRARVWECSHVGGHRFAPVTLSLPTGAVHGRLSADEGLDILRRADAGLVRPDRLRGRTCFPAPLQAAEVAVRQQAGIDGADDLDVLVVHGGRAVPADPGWPVPTGPVDLAVRHRDGRAWQVVVSHQAGTHTRAESCGADAVAVHAWVVDDLRPAEAWS